MTRSGALRRALLVALVPTAACGDGSTEPPVTTDACLDPPTPLALETSVSGVLEEGDCFSEEGRLMDRYLLVLPEPTLFRAALTTEGYFPHYPFYLDTFQVSGWASDRSTVLDREHILPAGSYEVQSTSFDRSPDLAGAPRGSYTLTTGPLDLPQEGCGRETTVTYGSVARGRVTADDCEAAQEAEPGVDRRLDGYTFLIDGEGTVVVTVTADFPFRFTHWSNGQPILQIPAIPAGESREVTVNSFGFQDFYVVNEEDGVFGSYTVSWGERPGG